MQKAIIQSIILIFFILPRLYSQNRGLPFQVSAAFGPAFPVGNFGKAGIDSLTKQSEAKTGPALIVSFAYQIKNSHFGFGITGAWQQNSVNGNALAKAMATSYPPGTQVFASSNSWHIWKLLAGPLMNFPLTHTGKLSFECGVAAGVLKTTLPGLIFNYANINNAVFTFSNPKTRLSSFCYQANAGIDYRLTRVISLNGNIIFSHADPVDHLLHYSLNPAPSTLNLASGPLDVWSTNPEKHIYPISTVTACIGISYEF